MAREILFKAKRKDNGEWVKGYLVKCRTSEEEGYAIKDTVYHVNDGIINLIPCVVDESTICQYTGLTDKNGNKIWENDVCNCQERGCGFLGCVVKWNRVMARFDVNAIGCDFAMTLEECVDDISINGFDYEVIGNIFDNPELLGGADNG